MAYDSAHSAEGQSLTSEITQLPSSKLSDCLSYKYLSTM